MNAFRLNSNITSSLLFVILGTVFIIQMTTKPLSDWGNYYYGSHFLLNGSFSKDVYEPYKFNLMVREQGETDVFLNYTPIPPFTALFYLPFQFTDAVTAKIIFSILSILAFSLSFYRLTRLLRISSYWLLLIPVVFIFPFRNNIFFGQTYLLIIAMLIEGFVAYKNGKNILAGLFWSAAILLKLFPGILLLFLLFKKDYRQLGYTVFFIMLLSVITALVTGFGQNVQYFSEIMPRMLNNEINDPYASTYQSMPVLLNKIFVYDKLLNPYGTINNPLLFKIFTYLFSLSILYIAGVYTLKSNDDDYIKFSFWLLCGLLLTGYGSGYSLLLMIFIVTAFLNKNENRKILTAFVFMFVFAITSVPVHLFSKMSLLLQFPRLYMMIAFFVFIIILFKIKPVYKYIYTVPVLALLLGYLNQPEYNNSSEYVMDKEEALLIYDYGESNGKLKINFIDQNGRNEKELKKAAAFQQSNVELKYNQVFYKGEQLTFTKDNKLMPLLTADNEIYYLSDKNRGVGFYTIRRLTINPVTQ
jgi:hypothetical protein